MSGFFPYALSKSIGFSGFFGPRKKTSSGGGTVLNFTMSPGFPSTGPLGSSSGQYPTSSGNGYQDGSNNTGFAGGGTIPSPVKFNGATINTAGWGNNMNFPNTLVLVLTGTLAQNFFSSWVFSDNFGNNYNLTSASAFFSTSLLLCTGFSVWQWANAQSFPFTGANVPMTINP